MKPVAITVILSRSPIASSITLPKMMFASSWAASWISEQAWFTSTRVMFPPPVMLIRMPVAPSICTSSRSGLSTAARAATIARVSPVAVPVPIRATPMLLMIVRTSAKSTLISPGMVIRSEMPCTALSRTSSAFLNVSSSVVFSSATASRRWFGIVISVSTVFFSSAIP